MEKKRARLGQGGANPFVDPDGFRAHVAARKRTFEETRAKERTEPAPGP
jgi:hypothetical protein